jgi:isoquinoline 1-oxidoreductase subunit beta
MAPPESSQAIIGVTRREFLITAVSVGGGLALSLPLPAAEENPESGGPGPGVSKANSPPRRPSAFLEIAPDGAITFTNPAVEMGQGGHTGMALIVMEELDGDWSRLTVHDSPPAAVYNNPTFGQQSTVGSFAVRGWYTELRRIGAAARAMLLQAAANEWGVPVAECSAARSVITHQPSGRTLNYGAVAARAAWLDVPQQPQLKPASAFTLIGSSPVRVDVAAKVDGSAQYGIDVRLPGMLYAAVRTSPTLTGRLKSFDDSAAKSSKGYRATARLDDGVIIIADSWWQARKALDKVTVEYEPGKLAGVDSATISQRLREAFKDKGEVARNDGDAAAALKGAAKIIEAVYEVPYLAHACMEPMSCTASISGDHCEIWCGTQAQQRAQGAVARALGIPPANVKVNTLYLGGGFGRRGESDYAAQAALAAKAAGQPVKLVWTREEDIQHDFYRPAAAARFRGGLDKDGRLIALECTYVTSSSPSFGSSPLGPSFYTGGITDTGYVIPNFRVTGINKDFGVRFGFWRSVNESHNPFMLEGFLDECARAAKQDPYQFRRAMLMGYKSKRQLALLDLLAEKSGWSKPRSGHHLGIACFPAFGSFIGSVVDVTMEGKQITLHKVISAIDCGTAVHPANIKAQMEGGTVYGLTAALRGEITLKNGAVEQGNFVDYPMLGMAEMPLIDTHIMPSSEAPGGVGEPATGPISGALANAIAAATGTRVRSLPLNKLDYTYMSART